MPSGFCLGDLVDSTDEEEPIHEETIYTPEWRLVEMLIEQFPDKVREHSVREQIEFHEAAEEMIEGYVMTGTAKAFIENYNAWRKEMKQELMQPSKKKKRFAPLKRMSQRQKKLVRNGV